MSVRPSPNIWRWPDRYAVENAAQDVHGAIWSAIELHAPFAGSTVVDIGCGDGFHLSRFAETAAEVIGIEPHPPLRERARLRARRLPNARAIAGTAEAMPLPESSVDVVHARTAYFFGPGCEAGLREAERVLRPGGALVIVDLDGNAAPYGDWLCADSPDYRPAEVEEFFASAGFASFDVATTWRFDRRAELESVLRIEFSPKQARRAIAETRGTEIPVGYRLRVRRKPTGIVLG